MMLYDKRETCILLQRKSCWDSYASLTIEMYPISRLHSYEGLILPSMV